jgi:uncharacterized Zn finger protein (UPF0148 family)
LTDVPDGEWFCPECEKDAGAPATSKKGKKKAKAQATEVEEDEPEPKAAGKRKASTKAKAGGGLDAPLPWFNILTYGSCSVKTQEVKNEMELVKRLGVMFMGKVERYWVYDKNLPCKYDRIRRKYVYWPLQSTA